MFFCVVVGLKCFNVFCSSGFSFIKFFCRVVFLVLRWLSLRSFLICRCRSLLFFFIIFRCCCIVGRLRFLFFSICFRGLRMSVSGVWSLWLMLVKNCDFIWFSFWSLLVCCLIIFLFVYICVVCFLILVLRCSFFVCRWLI